jgi:MoaA/NifB/PqqE/SkfB family radical SAM enzyme
MNLLDDRVRGGPAAGVCHGALRRRDRPANGGGCSRADRSRIYTLMSAPASSDSQTSVLLQTISPLAPGVVVDKRIALDGIEVGPDVKLLFRDLQGPDFGVRLQRSRPGAKYYATTGRLDLILDLSVRPSDAVERFVKRLAESVRANTLRMSDAQLQTLVPDVRLGNPYLRRHEMVGTANIVDINVGDGCNLRCTFCTDVDSRGPELFRPTSFWCDELARAYENGKRGVLISGNEPTLRSDVPEIIAEAKRLGFVEIELSTAGVRLANRSYLAELLDAGLNVLATSIHGSNAEIDGVQTGRPDFFEPRRRGFEHFLELVGDRAAQERRGVYLKTITIFTRQNLGDVPALVEFLFRYEVSYALLYYPWIKGAALHAFDDIAPDYPSVLAALDPLWPRLRDSSRRIDVANLPPCTTRDLPAGRTATKDIVHIEGRDDTSARRGRSSTVVRKASVMDPTLTYAEACTTCAARGRCGGVPIRYLARYGSAGLQPLREDA